MDLQRFPDDWPAWSNHDIGAFLLGYAGLDKAAELGVPLTFELMREIIANIPKAEARHADTAALEKSLHKAAEGDFETAGRLFREYMNNGAVAKKFIPIGMKRSAQAKKFGKAGAEKNKAEGKENRVAVLEAAKEILAQRTKRPTNREMAALIEKKTGIPANTARGHLTKLRKDNLLD